MKNLINDIQEFQNIILNDDKINYYKNIEISHAFENAPNNKNKNEENKKNSENIKKSYMDIYKPIFDVMAKRQNKNNNLNENKKQFTKYIIDYKKEDKKDKKIFGKNNFNLEEEFSTSSNAFNKPFFTAKKSKNKSIYRPSSSSKNKNKLKLIENFKNKYFKKDDQYFSVLNQNNLALKLNNMHSTISDMIEKDDRLYSNGYKNVINNILKEIDIIRKERKLENNIFEQQIKLLQNDILNDGKYNKDLKIKSIRNIYMNNKKPKSKNKNKRKTKSELGRSYQKNNKNRNNTKNNINYYNYIFSRTTNSINKKSSFPKKSNLSQKKKNYYSPKKYYQQIIDEINKLNHENEIIQKKYKNLPISNEQFEEIINIKCNRNISNKSFTSVDYKKNIDIIKKNMKLISNQIIDDLLYERLGDLAKIENQRSENNQKENLKNKLNNVRINLEEYHEKEKLLLQEYNNKNKNNDEIKENTKTEIKQLNCVYLPSKIKYKCVISNDLLKRCDIYQISFLDYMILKGSFYSDYNIFEIYDIFIEEISSKIMEEEIDYIIKKAHIYVDNICNDEMKEINQQ